MHHPTDRIAHTTTFVTPFVGHWLEREIAQWVHPMKDRSYNPSHHKRTLLPRSYISLPPPPPNRYQDQSLSYSTAMRWAAKLCHGRKSLEDYPKSGRPSTSITQENIDAVERTVTEDRRVTVWQIVLEIKLGLVKSIFKEQLSVSKVCALMIT